MEHDNFIDYEVEFVELPESASDNLEESDNIVISHMDSEDDSRRTAEITQQSMLHTKVNMESFVELLQRARIRHRDRTKTSPER